MEKTKAEFLILLTKYGICLPGLAKGWLRKPPGREVIKYLAMKGGSLEELPLP